MHKNPNFAKNLNKFALYCINIQCLHKTSSQFFRPCRELRVKFRDRSKSLRPLRVQSCRGTSRSCSQGHFLIQVWTKTAEKFPTWKRHLPLAALYGLRPIQVWTKTAEKFPTWKRHLPLAAPCDLRLIQVWTNTAEKFPTWKRHLSSHREKC
jgi:hypothetical protein